jgi:membrane fusion protein (multidrug efflux system)
LIGACGVIVLAAAAYFVGPWLYLMLNTVSTDDAYVNGHVTFVAPRVAGQVKEVLVDDNKHVKKGQLLVRLDPVPYQVQVDIKQAAVVAAETEVTAAIAKVRGLEGLARSQRWKLEYTMQQVANQVASLRALAAMVESKKATLALAKANLKRGLKVAPSGGITKEDLDQRYESVKVNEAAVEQALQTVYATRAGLGLPPQPPKGKPLTDVPPDLEQSYSGVRSALADVVQTVAQIGLPLPGTDATPKEVLDNFKKLDAAGDIDRILLDLIPKAPAVKQAKAKLLQAQRDLEQAELNLSYCNIVAEIDGLVTRRNVNPGNNVQVGQSLMALRSITDIWIDANFKETQLSYLRIGQPVIIEVDMWGRHHEFRGRVTGFTMGTGQTLSLLPPQNATGNFVKVVQRLPVRIDLDDYDPSDAPLFIGLSVTPYVYYKRPLIDNDPGKGDFLQPPETKLPVPSFPQERRPANTFDNLPLPASRMNPRGTRP